MLEFIRLFELTDDQLIKAVANGLKAKYTNSAKPVEDNATGVNKDDFDLLVVEFFVRFADS